jgi:hypothetical protein
MYNTQWEIAVIVVLTISPNYGKNILKKYILDSPFSTNMFGCTPKLLILKKNVCVSGVERVFSFHPKLEILKKECLMCGVERRPHLIWVEFSSFVSIVFMTISSTATSN